MSDTLWRAALVSGTDMRLWEMDGQGPRGPAATLSADALPNLPGPVIAAGLDVPGRQVPCPPLHPIVHAAGLRRVAAVPPLSQSAPAARSRGSEVAIAGYLDDHPNWDGVVVVCGSETLWAQCSAGEVVSFQTFLTPVLVAALGATARPGADFADALNATLSRPEALARHLASARTAATGQEAAHLIGAELAAARPYWLGQDVVVLGDRDGTYTFALSGLGVPARTGDHDETFVKGFALAWARIAS